MAFICVKNHVIFIKPIWYCYKTMSESTNHDVSVFVCRYTVDSVFVCRYTVVICIVAKCNGFNKKEKDD